MSTNDSILAFPQELGLVNKGMTLRDYFAAKVMAVLVASPSASLAATLENRHLAAFAAQGAYEAADALLAERAKVKP